MAKESTVYREGYLIRTKMSRKGARTAWRAELGRAEAVGNGRVVCGMRRHAAVAISIASPDFQSCVFCVVSRGAVVVVVGGGRRCVYSFRTYV